MGGGGGKKGGGSWLNGAKQKRDKQGAHCTHTVTHKRQTLKLFPGLRRVPVCMCA